VTVSVCDGVVVEGVRPRPAQEHHRQVPRSSQNDHQRQEPQEIRRVFSEVSELSRQSALQTGPVNK